jgi:hypothetical protein
MDGIEITITRLLDAGRGAAPAVQAMVRLVPIADNDPRRGGHGIYAATLASPSCVAWERRDFIAGEKAAAWAANEAEKLA